MIILIDTSTTTTNNDNNKVYNINGKTLLLGSLDPEGECLPNSPNPLVSRSFKQSSTRFRV